MRKIRIMHLRAISRTGWGGPDSGMLNGGVHLDRDRFEYTVIYMKRPDDDTEEFRERYRNVSVDYVEFEGKGIFDFGQFNTMLRYLREERPDIIHCHEERSDLYGLLLKMRIPGTKVINSIHGDWLITSPRRWLFTRIHCWLVKWLDMRIAVSEQVVEYADRRGVQTNRIVENGIDIDAWSPETTQKQDLRLKKPESRKWVGFVGRISLEKGTVEFVRMAERIAADTDEIDFVVAGRSEGSNHMLELVAELGLESRFRFLGELNPQQLRTFYGLLDVLVSPSLSEGLPNNLLEASAMAVPIVATRIGSVPDLIRHGYNGLLVDVGDIENLVEQTLKFINEPVLARRFGTHARDEVASRFSVTSHVQKMGRLYCDLVEQPAQHG